LGKVCTPNSAIVAARNAEHVEFDVERGFGVCGVCEILDSVFRTEAKAMILPESFSGIEAESLTLKGVRSSHDEVQS